MIAYTKAYGSAEAVRLINVFVNSQEAIYTNILKRINETKEQQ